MIISREDLKVVDKFANPFSVEQLAEGFRIFEEIIDNLDDFGARELTINLISSTVNSKIEIGISCFFNDSMNTSFTDGSLPPIITNLNSFSAASLSLERSKLS